MSAQQIIDRYQEAEGWTTDTVLDLLVSYIDNQDAPDALDDFLADAAYDGAPSDDDGLTDVEADAMALAGAGWGTDEDYGVTEADVLGEWS